jgi:hypothetical protein
MLCSLDRDHVTLQSLKSWSKFTTRLTENPPVVSVRSSIVSVSLRLNSTKKMLINLREAAAHIRFTEVQQVDYQRVSRSGRKVATIPVRSDVTVQSFPPTEAQVLRLCRG